MHKKITKEDRITIIYKPLNIFTFSTKYLNKHIRKKFLILKEKYKATICGASKYTHMCCQRASSLPLYIQYLNLLQLSSATSGSDTSSLKLFDISTTKI